MGHYEAFKTWEGYSGLQKKIGAGNPLRQRSDVPVKMQKFLSFAVIFWDLVGCYCSLTFRRTDNKI